MGRGRLRYARSRMLRILLVEDSPAMRSYVRGALEGAPELGEDLEVIEAASGFDALRLLPRSTVDLVITDINMPDINGLELINFVKKNPHYKDTPLFVVTTEGREQDRDRGLALGASEYLIKPFQSETLVDLVRKYLKLEG